MSGNLRSGGGTRKRRWDVAIGLFLVATGVFGAVKMSDPSWLESHSPFLKSAEARTLDVWTGSVDRHKGSVRYRYGNSAVWHEAVADQEAVTFGDAVFTAKGSQATLRFKNGPSVELSPDTLVVVQKLESKSAAQDPARETPAIEVKHGKVKLSIPQGASGPLRVAIRGKVYDIRPDTAPRAVSPSADAPPTPSPPETAAAPATATTPTSAPVAAEADHPPTAVATSSANVSIEISVDEAHPEAAPKISSSAPVKVAAAGREVAVENKPDESAAANDAAAALPEVTVQAEVVPTPTPPVAPLAESDRAPAAEEKNSQAEPAVPEPAQTPAVAPTLTPEPVSEPVVESAPVAKPTGEPAPVPAPSAAPTPEPSTVAVPPSSAVQGVTLNGQTDRGDQNQGTLVNERYGTLWVASELSFSRINSTDKNTGGTASYISNLTPGLRAAWGQHWSDSFQTSLNLGIRSESYLTPQGVTLDGATHTLGDLGVGARYVPFKGLPGLSIDSRFEVRQELFARATSLTATSLDAVMIPELMAGLRYRVVDLSPFSVSLHAQGILLLPGSTSNYSIQTGGGSAYGAAISESLSRNLQISGDFWYFSQSQSSSIATQDRVDVGVTIGVNFRFDGVTKPDELKRGDLP